MTGCAYPKCVLDAGHEGRHGAMKCASCGRSTLDHCHVHALRCCPGKCPGVNWGPLNIVWDSERLPDWRAEFVENELRPMAEMVAERMQGYADLLAEGKTTAADLRRLENMNPADDDRPTPSDLRGLMKGTGWAEGFRHDDTEVAEMLRKVIRQYHGIAHSHLGKALRGGSWTHCEDRWCVDVRKVLDE